MDTTDFILFFAHSQLPSDIKKSSFSIPSGNYGNLFSAIVSKELGLPIENIISSNNINNPVRDIFNLEFILQCIQKKLYQTQWM